jgi:hypothetical protein
MPGGVATPVASVTAQTSYSDPTICHGSFLIIRTL